jgi:hypothetical protein
MFDYIYIKVSCNINMTKLLEDVIGIYTSNTYIP